MLINFFLHQIRFQIEIAFPVCLHLGTQISPDDAAVLQTTVNTMVFQDKNWYYLI